MPKVPRLTASEAEALLLNSGFELIRTKGSHRIYRKGQRRCIIPFHAGRDLHPKVIKQILKAIEEG